MTCRKVTFDKIYARLCGLLDNQPIIERRGMKIKELNGCHFKIDSDFILKNPIRNISYEYLSAELYWYMSGSLDASEIGKHAGMWLKIADEHGKVQSNYGFFVFEQKQFQWCFDALKKDLHTRQALINYNQPMHKKEGTKDFPCTIAQSFMYDCIHNKLDTYVYMRSSDIIYGLSYDIPWFAFVMNKLAEELSIKPGSIYFTAMSLHCYEKHFNMVHEIAQDMNVYK